MSKLAFKLHAAKIHSQEMIALHGAKLRTSSGTGSGTSASSYSGVCPEIQHDDLAFHTAVTARLGIVPAKRKETNRDNNVEKNTLALIRRGWLGVGSAVTPGCGGERRAEAAEPTQPRHGRPAGAWFPALPKAGTRR